MLALSEGVQIAIISSTAVVAVAGLGLIPSLLSRSQAKRGADAIGTPNGEGTVVQMLGTVLRRQADAEVKAESRHSAADVRLGNVETHLLLLDSRVTNLEKPAQVVVNTTPAVAPPTPNGE